MTIRIGYAAGAFDLFHIGHLNILNRAKENCDYLIAGVASDEMCERNKGQLPVIPLEERLEIISSLRCVDRAFPEVLPDKLDTWSELGFNIYFKGDDWKGTPRGLELEDRFARVGVSVHYFPYTVQTSSTLLRSRLGALAPLVGTDAGISVGHSVSPQLLRNARVESALQA